MTNRYAFFDVDGTIIARDSFRLLQFKLLCMQPWRIFILPLVLPIFIFTVLFLKDRRWPKSVILWSLTCGLSPRKCVKSIRLAMQNEWHKIWFCEATPCLKNLREIEKLSVVFVSASGQVWLRHLLQEMDPGTPKIIIGSRLGWFCGGVVFKSKNCFGPEKIVRIHERLGTDLKWVTGYSDSHVDIPMLEKCDVRVVISPTKLSLLRFTKTFLKNFRCERWTTAAHSKGCESI